MRFDDLAGGTYFAVREMNRGAWIRAEYRLALDTDGGACFEQWWVLTTSTAP